MGDNSKIEWTDTTWNPILGCTKVSAGCKNCYAMRVVHRLASNPNPKIADANAGLTKMTSRGPEWTGTARLIPERLDQPLRWKRPRMIFVNSLSDIGHEDLGRLTPRRIVDVMRKAPQHTYQVLSKRAERLKDIIADTDGDLPHIWWGVTVEDQAAAASRLDPLLSAVRSAQSVRWASVEPLLGPLNLRPWLGEGGLSWVVVGGESGPGARPMEVEWALDVVRQASVPVFFKQGSSANWPSYKDFDSFPVELRVREMPTAPTS
jgi:protein gp37